MIKSVKDQRTAALFQGYFVKGIPTDIAKRAQNKLKLVNAAKHVQDLRSPPAHHLEKLVGDLEGYWSIRVNQQWRIVFRWHEDNAWEVWFTDYH
jgi:proteic killer suppression protein